MNPLRSIPFALAALFLAACESTSTYQQEPTSAPKSEEAKKEDQGDKEGELRKKQHDLAYARFQLEIAKSDAQNGEMDDQLAVTEAEHALAAAKADLDNFRGAARDLETAERTLGLDRAKQNVVESQQELEELEAMYGQEQFAKTTKELVLTRGRSHLDMAKRDLELSQRRTAQLTSFDQPKKERELTEAMSKADAALAQARAKLERNKLQRKLDGLKAEHAVEDAERALAKLQSGAPK